MAHDCSCGYFSNLCDRVLHQIKCKLRLTRPISYVVMPMFTKVPKDWFIGIFVFTREQRASHPNCATRINRRWVGGRGEYTLFCGKKSTSNISGLVCTL